MIYKKAQILFLSAYNRLKPELAKKGNLLNYIIKTCISISNCISIPSFPAYLP